jgi:hypothetical protein
MKATAFDRSPLHRAGAAISLCKVKGQGRSWVGSMRRFVGALVVPGLIERRSNRNASNSLVRKTL